MNDHTLFKQILSSINAPTSAFDDFQNYQRLLLEWNRRMNLISKNDEPKIIRRHFIDSLALLKAVDFQQNIRILDMGTGAGFPGIPIRLVRPDINLVVLESKRNRGLFIKQLLSELNLTSEISVIIGRAEACADLIDPVNMVCSRAVANASTLIRLGAPYLKSSGGCIIALKGTNAESELSAVPRTINRFSVHHIRFIPFEPFPQYLPNRLLYVLDIQLKAKGL